MLLSATLPVFLASAALIIPGIIWAWWCYPASDGATRLAVGIAVGFAFQIQICALLAIGPRITTTSVITATLVGSGLAVLLVWLTRHHGLRLRTSIFNRQSAGLAALLILVVLPRLLPLAVLAIPPGWDTSFHSLLASTTVKSGRLPSWQPFEPISSNYPYGTHVFIAEVTLITGIAPDVVFGILIFAVQPLITCLALYSLTRRALRSHAYALGAVAAYGLLGHWGSIQYPLWGGLPNALGFFLLLVFLCVLFAPGFNRVRILVGGIILGAIPLTHHHVMLTTALLLTSYVVYLVAWTVFKGKSEAVRLEVRGHLTRLGLTCLVAIISVSYYVIPVGLRVTELGKTQALEYFDIYAGYFIDKNGRLLWELAMVGIACVIAGISLHKSGRLVLRHSKSALSDLARTFLATSIAALLLAFFFCYHAYRYYSFHFTAAHQLYTLFTPTRFLTDMTYFLAPFAGIPLAIAWQWPVRWSRMATAYIARNIRSLAAVVARGVIALVLITICLSDVATQINWNYGHLQNGEAEAFAWVKAHTSASTLVVNLDPDAIWAPYFTQREVAYTPIPTSEFTSGYVSEKQALVGILLQMLGQSPRARLVTFAGEGSAMRALAGRPVAIVSNQPIPGVHEPPAFISGPERVYLVGDALAFSQQQFGVDAPIELQWWAQSSMPAAGWSGSTNASTGWIADTSATSHLHPDIFLRIVLTQALPAGSQIACRAQNGVQVYVDNHEIQGGCTDSSHLIASLLMSGPHVIGIHFKPGSGNDAWYQVALQEPGE